jgi:hypothetical protein
VVLILLGRDKEIVCQEQAGEIERGTLKADWIGLCTLWAGNRGESSDDRRILSL